MSLTTVDTFCAGASVNVDHIGDSNFIDDFAPSPQPKAVHPLMLSSSHFVTVQTIIHRIHSSSHPRDCHFAAVT